MADAVLVGAGDIADCARSGDSKTAALVEAIPGTVFTAGDNVYPHGALGDVEDCYEPTWGAFRNRTRPSPGNHDYETLDALVAGGHGVGEAMADLAQLEVLGHVRRVVGGRRPGLGARAGHRPP